MNKHTSVQQQQQQQQNHQKCSIEIKTCQTQQQTRRNQTNRQTHRGGAIHHRANDGSQTTGQSSIVNHQFEDGVVGADVILLARN